MTVYYVHVIVLDVKRVINRREYHNRRRARPFDKSKAMHIVMHTHLKGAFHIRSIRTWLKGYVPLLAHKKGIRLYHFAIVSNHLHIVLRAGSKQALSIFLRVLAGVIARRVLRADRGRKAQVKMWLKRPYSRVLSWGREFHNVLYYVHRNLLEASKTLKYEARSGQFSRESTIKIGNSFRKHKFNIQSFLVSQPILPGFG